MRQFLMYLRNNIEVNVPGAEEMKGETERRSELVADLHSLVGSGKGLWVFL